MATTTTTRKPRAPRAPQDRKVAAAKRAVVETEGIEPLDLDAEPQTTSDEVVHLFTLNEVDYYIPKEPKASVSLKYLRMSRQDLTDAQGWLLEQLLGPDAYTALMDWDGLTADILRRLLAIVNKLAVDAAEKTQAATSGPLGRG